MERYIEQLIEDLRMAHKPEGMVKPLRFEGNAEFTTTMVQLTGIDLGVFPPIEKLSESQFISDFCFTTENPNFVGKC